MVRRAGLLIATLLVLNLTACALLDIALLPLKLLFNIVGGAASAVGIADVRPSGGSAPVVESAGEERWLVTNLSADVPCTIVCSAPGCDPQSFAWPSDFARGGENVTVQLERSR